MESNQFLRIYLLKWPNIISDSGLRIYSSSDNVDNENPLLVVVRQEKGILSWKIPFFIKREDSKKYDLYYTVIRTLCPIRNYPLGGTVNCGGHTATSCGDCPQGNGQSWCNGECSWFNDQCQASKGVYDLTVDF